MAIYGIRNRPGFTNYISSLQGTRADSYTHGTTNKRYYSSIDAEIYFGDFYVDEIVQIAFSIEQNVMPLFGYNSYVYDEVAVGSRLINGQFTINFTKANYLFELLGKLDTTAAMDADQSETSKEDDGEDSDSREYLNADGSQIVKKEGSDRFTSTNYGGIKQARRPLWFTGFDIDVMVGRATTISSTAEHLMLEGVYLMNSNVGLDASGQPITETYTFMARDIRTVSI